jgi:hypothetical protein
MVGRNTATHLVFERRLESEVAFVAPLAIAPPGAADLAFERRGPAAGDDVDWTADALARRLGADFELGRRAGDLVLRSDGGRIDFRLAGGRIVAHAAPTVPDWLIELRFLGPVMAMWLELAGVVALHGSAVAVGEHAIGFLAGNRAGKTTLASALLAAGHALLGDDLLAIEAEESGFRVLPAYPFVRLEPDDAARWTGAPQEAIDALPRAHADFPKRIVPVGDGEPCWGRFHGRPAPLAALVLPERRSATQGVIDGPRLVPIPPAEALVLLAGLSAAPRLAAAAGLSERRLASLARLVEAVPLWRLRYASGHERLPAVVDRLRSAFGWGA